MMESEQVNAKITSWCQCLPDADLPCGPDLEYDNDFLALMQAATGKAETQFAPAEPPDWPAVVQIAETLLDKSRDLRIGVMWARAMVHLHGWSAVPSGLQLIHGLMLELWEHLHPMPDPDDGSPYGRVNALATLGDGDGLLGDLRASRVFAERSIGEVTGRMVEVAAGLAVAHEGDADVSSAVLERMFADAEQKLPALRNDCQEAVVVASALAQSAQDRLGEEAPSMAPVLALLKAVVALLPSETGSDAEAIDDSGDPSAADGQELGRGAGRGLSSGVRTREEALRAIDLVCEFLERTEPANPAPLYLRRGRELINHNFLQLIKLLAPEALNELARVVGVDPDSVYVSQDTLSQE